MNGNYLDVYELHHYLYNVTGYGQVDFRRAWHKLLYSLYHATLISILIFNNAVCLYLTLQARDDPKEVMYLLTMTLTTCGGSIKIFAMDVHRKGVLKLHHKLKKHLYIRKVSGYCWMEELERDMETKFIFITKILYWFVCAAILAFLVSPVFFPGERALPYVFPVQNLSSPYYEAVYVVHFIVTILFIVNTISYDMVCCGFLIRLCSHLDIIATRLDKFSEEYSFIKKYNNGNVLPNKNLDFKTVEFLKQIVQHHEEVMRQLGNVDSMFSMTIFMILIGGTVVFCIAASVLFTDNFDPLKDIRLGTYSLAGFANLFLYCYCGNLIYEYEAKVEFSLYSLPWYDMDMKVRKMLTFALMRLYNAKGMTAGKIFRVNLDLFLNLLKFAHSFIALLKEV